MIEVLQNKILVDNFDYQLKSSSPILAPILPPSSPSAMEISSDTNTTSSSIWGKQEQQKLLEHLYTGRRFKPYQRPNFAKTLKLHFTAKSFRSGSNRSLSYDNAKQVSDSTTQAMSTGLSPL